MKNWPWKLYGTFLVFLMSQDITAMTHEESSFRMYYTILLAFDKHYFIFLLLNVLSVAVNLFVPLVVFYYAFEIKSSLKFWKALFFARIFFDLTGHFYDMQFIKSSFVQSPSYGLAAIGAFLIPIIPAYVAHYRYAFGKTSVIASDPPSPRLRRTGANQS